MMIVVIAATNMLSENRIMNAPTINKIEFVYRVARFGLLLAHVIRKSDHECTYN